MTHEPIHAPPTSHLFRRAMGQFATGVTVVTVEYEPGKIHGMTANSFTSVSLHPPLVLICVDYRALMLPFLHAQKRFGVSVLKQEQQAIAEFFAQPGLDEDVEDRLKLRYTYSPSGIPTLQDALARLSCNVTVAHVSGDHTVFFGEVETAEIGEGHPLLFYQGRYRQL
jgi:flavin reductase (DIM6/NTAB) family NADH-FMN oxidoreductase RutF